VDSVDDHDQHENDVDQLPAPVHQDRVFVIMYPSNRSGGTYTELRKSIQGKNRFMSGLRFMGYDMSKVHVFEQNKIWVPEPKKNKKPKLRETDES
jgi:hypothetical protein